MGDISLVYLLELAWKRIWALILTAVLFATGAFCYCRFLAVPQYISVSSILVTNGAIVTQYSSESASDSDSVRGTDISASLSLANTVTDILKTPDIYIKLSEELGGSYKYDQLQGMISVARRNNDTLFIDINVKYTDGEEAKRIANKFASISCNYVAEYIPNAKARVASSAMGYAKVYPRTVTVTAISGIVGAVVAFLIAFIADFLNQSIRGEDEFVSKYNIPLLGAVPDFENDEIMGIYHSKKHGYISSKKYSKDSSSSESDEKTIKSAPFAVVEAYKSIRSNLMFLLEKSEHGNIISVTSSNAGEGKSTTAVNLAVAFSQLEDRILVVDADMRRSSVHKKLHLDNNVGLSNVLAGLADFDSAVKKISDNFHVLTSGQTPPNPSEMLGSKKFSSLIEHLRRTYDYVIIDTPPLNIVSDSLIISPLTDGIVFIIRDGLTPNFTIKRALSTIEFANTKVLGAVMNGAHPKSNGKYIYRKYSYRSKYYNQYYKYGYDKNYSNTAGRSKKSGISKKL